jgi:ABC-type nitrate/sulfonate/bicarbonate transport system ATPase subunit
MSRAAVQSALAANRRKGARSTHRLGMVFQGPTLMDWCTARKNVRLPFEMANKLKQANSE